MKRNNSGWLAHSWLWWKAVNKEYLVPISACEVSGLVPILRLSLLHLYKVLISGHGTNVRLCAIICFQTVVKPAATKWLFTWNILLHNMCLAQPNTYNQNLSRIMGSQTHWLLLIPVVSIWFTVHTISLVTPASSSSPFTSSSSLTSFSCLCILVGTERLAAGTILTLWLSCWAIIPSDPSMCC